VVTITVRTLLIKNDIKKDLYLNKTTRPRKSYIRLIDYLNSIWMLITLPLKKRYNSTTLESL
jgi:hypothetical protein